MDEASPQVMTPEQANAFLRRTVRGLDQALQRSARRCPLDSLIERHAPRLLLTYRSAKQSRQLGRRLSLPVIRDSVM